MRNETTPFAESVCAFTWRKTSPIDAAPQRLVENNVTPLLSAVTYNRSVLLIAVVITESFFILLQSSTVSISL